MYNDMKNMVREYLINLMLNKYLLNDYPYRKYMRNKKIIFIHIPKVAGSSIIKWLDPNSDTIRDHCTYKEFLDADTYKFNNYFKFCFVRQPLTRIQSVYYYWINGGNNMDDLFYRDLLKKKCVDINDFILNFLNETKIHEHKLLKPQYLYIFDDRNNLMIDYLGKYEDITKEIMFLSEKLNIKNKFDQLNKSSYPKERTQISPEAIQRISTLYAKDFELLSYRQPS